MAPSLLSDAKAVVFDAYGTLFDVHSAVMRHRAAIGPDATRLSDLWRTKQLEYSWVLSLAGRYEPFWTLTERALDYALARCPAVDRTLKPALLDAYRRLDAYDDARATLDGLRHRGLRTAILSNGDTEMLDASVSSAELGGSLDAVLSVDAARIFKTHPRAYEIALAIFAAVADEIVFVSSNRWDIAGATAFGFRTIWINRAGLPDEYAELAPRAVVSSLDALLDA
ncbi:haloacid dehalogenase type II [Microvirga puerhi]|uniref:(S)-2-haloacid dehalogenase n=1 Tax=Microvirga puerhi TaxID=2876078 RepID=A0ABS7VN18_9HYPH|nr:haloacid dehalogenase type II [Microvirga puerhi]MBZ6076343.1 haloacid dehalogenase type II [Microvirga puerhi]